MTTITAAEEPRPQRMRVERKYTENQPCDLTDEEFAARVLSLALAGIEIRETNVCCDVCGGDLGSHSSSFGPCRCAFSSREAASHQGVDE